MYIPKEAHPVRPACSRVHLLWWASGASPPFVPRFLAFLVNNYSPGPVHHPRPDLRLCAHAKQQTLSPPLPPPCPPRRHQQARLPPRRRHGFNANGCLQRCWLHDLGRPLENASSRPSAQLLQRPSCCAALGESRCPQRRRGRGLRRRPGPRAGQADRSRQHPARRGQDRPPHPGAL